MSQWLIIGGLVLGGAAGLGLGWYVAAAGVLLMGFATVFSFITLPVEYDASHRALAWLKAKNIVTPNEYVGSEDALKWAARTYLVAAIGALANLLYWALQVFGGRD
jgi:Zn-dependent membrane protease YugP